MSAPPRLHIEPRANKTAGQLWTEVCHSEAVTQTQGTTLHVTFSHSKTTYVKKIKINKYWKYLWQTIVENWELDAEQIFIRWYSPLALAPLHSFHIFMYFMSYVTASIHRYLHTSSVMYLGPVCGGNSLSRDAQFSLQVANCSSSSAGKLRRFQDKPKDIIPRSALSLSQPPHSMICLKHPNRHPTQMPVRESD